MVVWFISKTKNIVVFNADTHDVQLSKFIL